MNCQLAAYIGDRHLTSVLLNSLKIQEPLYGGHATGMGVLNDEKIDIIKAAGPVDHVKKTTKISMLKGTCAIAHCRYSGLAKDVDGYNLDVMAHPYISDDGKIALMHNGGIANYKELWKALEKDHTFRSYGKKVDDITDSEVAVHMLSDAYNSGMSMVEAFQHIAPKLTGMFLLAVINVHESDTVYICNWHQPCYIALGKNEAMFVSSRRGLRDVDMDRIFQPPKNSVIKLTRGGVEVHVMDPSREIPRMTMNEFKAKRMIINTLKENGRMDVRKLFQIHNPEGWAEVYGISANEWKAQRATGIYIMTPYFELLESMVADGVIEESIDPRLEGGFEDVPRYSYVLA
jgi:glucosamine 6-phosphate synthetase-like amidotransferase/phosphosugar isomerase protein